MKGYASLELCHCVPEVPFFFFFFFFPGSWKPEKAQGACRDDMPSEEEKGRNTEEEDRDVMDSWIHRPLRKQQEKINLLLVEQHRAGMNDSLGD